MSSFKEIARNIKLKSLLTKGTEVLTAASYLTKSRDPVNIALSAIKAVTTIANITEVNLQSYIVEVKWSKIDISQRLVNPLFDIACAETKDIISSSDNCTVVSLNGIAIAKTNNGIFTYKKSEIKNAKKILLKMLGDHCTNTERIRMSSKLTGPYGHSEFVFEKEEAPEAFTSGTLEDVYKRLKKFSNVGLSRTILLWGPPGTGKTSIANGLAKKIGGLCIEIFASDIQAFTDIDLVRAMAPTVIIVNDIDHIQHPTEAILNFFEDVKKVAKVVIITANTVDLKQALKRPGRFDELVNVKNLSGDVFDKVAGDMVRYVKPTKEQEEELKKWPVAFLQELVHRVSNLGIEVFSEEYEELKQRVDNDT